MGDLALSDAGQHFLRDARWLGGSRRAEAEAASQDRSPVGLHVGGGHELERQPPCQKTAQRGAVPSEPHLTARELRYPMENGLPSLLLSNPWGWEHCVHRLWEL